MAQHPPVGRGFLIIEDTQSHSDTPHSEGHLWTSDQPDEDTSDNTQQSQQTCFHVIGGIRTRNASKRAAADRAAIGIGRTATQLSGGGSIPFPSFCVLERWSKPNKAKHDSK
jgi:hypothetical protein